MRMEITDLRTITDDAPVVRNFEFRSGTVTLGSHSESLLQLPDVEIAAHHATIERVGDVWTYRPTTRDDKQTRINGQPSNGPVELKDGDVLVITHFEIRVEIEPEGAGVEVTQVGRLGELAMIKQYPIPPRSTARKSEEKITLSASRQRSAAEFSAGIAACRDLGSLMEATLRLLETELSARLAWFGARKDPSGPLEFMDGRLDGAVSMVEPPRLDTYVYRCLNRLQHLSIPRTGDGVTQSVVAVPIIAGQETIGLLYADTKRRTRVFDDADLDFITFIAAMVRPPLQKFLQSASAMLGSGAAQTSGNSSVAGWALVHEFRDKIEPKKLPQWPLLELAHFGLKGNERAGDIIDVIRMPNGLAAVLVGHVTAEPSRTAMAISEIRGAFRVAGLHADPPRVQLRELNWLLSDKEHPCTFEGGVTVINPKSGAFEISTAGNTGACLIATGGKAKSLVLADAPAVGNGQVVEYKGLTGKLSNSETLALFTAGAAEARNADGAKLGAQRLIETLCEGFGQSAGASLDELTGDLGSYLKHEPQSDDGTIVIIHRPE